MTTVLALASAGCVYIPPTAVLLAIQDPLVGVAAVRVEVFDATNNRLLYDEQVTLPARTTTPRARCLSIVPDGALMAGAQVPVLVRLRTLSVSPAGAGVVTSAASVRTTMRQGERRLVRVPWTAGCARDESAACLARPASEADCGVASCRCAAGGCLDDARTCTAIDLARPDEVRCSPEPVTDDGVLAGTAVDEDGCLAPL